METENLRQIVADSTHAITESLKELSGELRANTVVTGRQDERLKNVEEDSRELIKKEREQSLAVRDISKDIIVLMKWKDDMSARFWKLFFALLIPPLLSLAAGVWSLLK